MHPKTKQMESILSRREWLTRTLQVSVAGTLTVLAAACQKNKASVCADPANLTDAENSLRESLHFTEESTRSDQTCAKCGFFEGTGTSACGTCKLLKGPVNPRGRCDSWSAAKT
jgi:High potential iron-sulfur protein